MELRMKRLQRFIFTGTIILVSLKYTEELASECGSTRYPINTPIHISGWECCYSDSHCIGRCGSRIVQKYCNITDPNIACPVIDLPWFKCRDKKRCYPRQARCDGHKSCEDGSDEIGCSAEPMKASNVFDVMGSLTSDLHNFAIIQTEKTLITKIALALSSTDRRFLKPNKDTREAIVSELSLQLLTKLTLKKKMSTYELSDYINALIVTCINPRDFFGFNLVAELRKRASQSNYTNPYTVLTLCNARAKILMDDVIELQNLFNAHLRTPWTETQALITMALACISSHSGLQIEEKIIPEMVKELKMKQLKNGTVESLRTTALVVQALLATNSYQTEFDVHGAVELMIKTRTNNLMDIYYILPVLNHMTLVDISSDHCAEDNEPNTETKNLQDVPQNYILVQFSLYIGEKKQLLKTWKLKVPDTFNLYQILEFINFLEQGPSYKIKYVVSNGKPYVVSVGNIIEDPEVGEFWFIYKQELSPEGNLKLLFKESPVDVPVKTNKKLILWYKRGDWYPSIDTQY